MFWNQYPYINLNDLNLDFLLKAIGEMQNEVKNFVTLNAVKYADPIQWNISSQYEKNTIVIDPLTGTAYISVQPVPSGVALNRTEYWTPVFDLSLFITQGNANLTEHVEDSGVVYSTFALNKNDWVIWNGILYKVLVNMPIGTAYSIDGNIERVTVEEYIKAILTAITAEVQAREDADIAINNTIGDLDDLDTTDKSSIVNAINDEVQMRGDADIAINNTIGDLDNLTTTNKSNVVNAINEVVNSIGSLNPTQAVLAEYFGAVGDGVADDTAAIQNAINNAQIVILKNTYRITSSITVREGVVVMGKGNIIIDGQFDAFVMGNNCTITGLSFSDTLTSYLDDNMVIYADRKNNLTISNCVFSNIHVGYCIRLDKCERLTIEHNNINGYSYAGIMLINGCQHGNLQYNKIINGKSSNANRYPISFSGYFEIADRPARFIKCNYNEIQDSTPVWEGIDSHGCEDCEVIGNTISGTRYGIAFGNPSTPTLASGNSCKNVVIKNNIISVIASEGLVYGISINSTNNHGRSDVENIEIDNNRIVTSGTPSYTTSIISAIAFRTTEVGLGNIKVSNNKISGVTNGISFEGINAGSVLVENNYLRSLTTAGTAAINFRDCLANYAADNINIIGNMISDCALDFAGPTSALTGRGLIHYEKNIDSGNYTNILYSTNARASAPGAITKQCGMPGDMIPMTGSATTWAWICNGPNHWVSVVGTVF